MGSMRNGVNRLAGMQICPGAGWDLQGVSGDDKAELAQRWRSQDTSLQTEHFVSTHETQPAAAHRAIGGQGAELSARRPRGSRTRRSRMLGISGCDARQGYAANDICDASPATREICNLLCSVFPIDPIRHRPH